MVEDKKVLAACTCTRPSVQEGPVGGELRSISVTCARPCAGDSLVISSLVPEPVARKSGGKSSCPFDFSEVKIFWEQLFAPWDSDERAAGKMAAMTPDPITPFQRVSEQKSELS